MKRRLVTAAGGLALLLALYGGSRLIRKLSFFEVRRIELVGGRYLTAADVARALAVRKGASIFDDTAPYLRRVRKVAGVREAAVTRRLPGTIRVTIREADVVALTQQGGRLVPLDVSGRALPFDPTGPADNLPLADADAAVASVLGRVREEDPALFARIQRGDRAGRDVALATTRGRILFRADATGDEIRDLSLIEDLLARRGERWRELDARFASRIVVRGRSA
ncbi:MAG TPA: FtsQ-type POTRA domain-containing protein [Gemmatimonadales bacterium]